MLVILALKVPLPAISYANKRFKVARAFGVAYGMVRELSRIREKGGLEKCLSEPGP